MMEVMTEIMEGKATPAQIGAFMTALRMKGETVDEVTGAARVMRAEGHPDRRPLARRRRHLRHGRRRRATPSTSPPRRPSSSAAAGLTVAKHGNRAVSSGCGSADVLEAPRRQHRRRARRSSRSASSRSASAFSSRPGSTGR